MSHSFSTINRFFWRKMEPENAKGFPCEVCGKRIDGGMIALTMETDEYQYDFCEECAEKLLSSFADNEKPKK